MLQGISSGKPGFGVHNEELLDQIKDVLRTVSEFFVLKVIFGMLNFVKDFVSVLALERKVPGHENVKKDTKGPCITLAVILSIQHFWRHVIRCTSNCLQFLIALLPLRQTKINQLQFIIGRQHYILWLDISMHHLLRVHMMKRSKQLLHVLLGHFFAEDLILLLSNFLKQLSTTNVLHDKVNILFINVCLIVLHDIRMV